MLLLVRVDDRLLHGQVLGAWVPKLKAELLVVASDEAARDSFRTAVMEACSGEGLRVEVRTVEDTIRTHVDNDAKALRTILVVGELKDARRLYDGGIVFNSLNIGNIHHSLEGCRKLTHSVVIDPGDDEIIEGFEARGVEIDIRDLPAKAQTPYVKR